MKKKKRLFACILAFALTFTSFMPSSTFAEDEITTDANNDTTDNNTDSLDITSDVVTNNDVDYQVLTEDELSKLIEEDGTNSVEDDISNTIEDNTSDIIDTDIIEDDTSIVEDENTDIIDAENANISSTEVTTEEVNEDVSEDEVFEESNIIEFNKYYSMIDDSLVNTTDLLVQTSDPSIFTKNTNVVSNYDDIYIISCQTIQEARYVYSYYIDKVKNISDMSELIDLAEPTEEDIADLSNVNDKTTDAIANLNNIDIKDYSGYIAIIDSGVNNDSITKFSVLDDDGKDNIGHGTNMYNYMLEENPDAKIISIKAFDGYKSNAANICAAIKLAIESNVDIINLSFAGIDNETNAIVKDIINDAINSGIIVIGAAGNNGKDASNYIPGCIDNAIVIGACDQDGVKVSTSNSGATVDYYVVANSTSEATARYSAIKANNRTTNNSKIFKTVTINENEETDEDGEDFELQYQENNTVVARTYKDSDASIETITYNNITYNVPKYFNISVTITGHAVKGTGFFGEASGTYHEANGYYDIGGKHTIPDSRNFSAHTYTNLGPYFTIDGKSLKILSTGYTTSNLGYSLTLAGYDATNAPRGFWCDASDKSAYYKCYLTTTMSRVTSTSYIKEYNNYLYIPYRMNTGIHFKTNKDKQGIGGVVYIKVPKLYSYYAIVRKSGTIEHDDEEKDVYWDGVSFKITYKNKTYVGWTRDNKYNLSNPSLYTDSKGKAYGEGTSAKPYILKGNHGASSIAKHGVMLLYLGEHTSAPSVSVKEITKSDTIVSYATGTDTNWYSYNTSTAGYADAYPDKNKDNVYEFDNNKGRYARTDVKATYTKSWDLHVKKFEGNDKITFTEDFIEKDEFINNIEVDSDKYYIVIRKEDNHGLLLNNVTFDIKTTLNGKTNTYTKGIKTGMYTILKSDGTFKQNAKYDGSTVPRGYSIVYIGKSTSAPTLVQIKENWNTSDANADVYNVSGTFLYSAPASSYQVKGYSSFTDIANGKILKNTVDMTNNTKYTTVTNTQKPTPYYVAFNKMVISGENTFYIQGVTFDLSYNYIDANGVTHTFKANQNHNGSQYVYSGCVQKANLTDVNNYHFYSNAFTNADGTAPGTLNDVETVFDHYNRITDPDDDRLYKFFPYYRKNGSGTGTNFSSAGTGIVYLGDFMKAPTNVTLQENWSTSHTNGGVYSDYNKGTAYVYKSGGNYLTDMQTLSGNTITRTKGIKVTADDFEHNTDTITCKEIFTDIKGKYKDNSAYFYNSSNRFYNYINTFPVRLHKTCTANPNNPNYSIIGTEYNLYDSITNVINNNPLGSFTITDKTGYSDTIDISPLDYNIDENTNKTFYIKEVDVGKNINGDDTYTNNPNNYIEKEITYDDIQTYQTTKTPITFEAKDKINKDPINIYINKKDKYTNDYVKGSETTAKFKFTYYAADVTQNYSKSYLEEHASSIDHQSFELNVIEIDDGIYRTEKLQENLEMGYLTIDEVTPPTGYSIDDFNVYVYDKNGSKHEISSNLVFILDNNVTIEDGLKKNNSVRYILDNGVRYEFNPNDESTEVNYHDGWTPIIRSYLTSTSTGKKIGTVNVDESATDTVYFKDVPKGIEIHVAGKLYDVATHEVIAEATTMDGKTPIVAVSEGLEEQSIQIKYSYDASKLQDKTLSDTLWVTVTNVETGEEVLVYTHNEDLTDKQETIYYPNGYTTAYDIDTGIDLMSNKTDATIVDNFYFTNLVAKNTYKVEGEIHKRDKETKKDLGVLVQDGKNVVKTAYITINEDGTATARDENGKTLKVTSQLDANGVTASGFVEIEFTVDASVLMSVTTTAFETLLIDDIEIFVHANINDKAQQVHFAKLDTLLKSDITNEETAAQTENDSATDVLTFDTIPVGVKITFNGQLVNKETKDVVATKDVELVINADGTTNSEGAIITDYDIDDELDEDNRGTDTVTGTIPMTFTFDSSEYENVTLVSIVTATYENADGEKVEVILHDDMNDKQETIYYSDLHTKATDINTNADVSKLGTTQVVDRVELKNLLFGKDYTITGTVHRKKLADDGVTVIDLGPLEMDLNGDGTLEEVTKTTVVSIDNDGKVTLDDYATNPNFKVSEINDNAIDGTIDIVFDINKDLIPGEDIVVFEKLSRDVLLMAHENIEDKDQTIRVPKCGTTAMDEDTKDEVGTVKEGDNVRLTDTVQFENIAAGHSYKVVGTIMDKTTEKELVLNDSKFIVTAEFEVDNDGNVTSATGNIIEDVVTHITAERSTVDFKIKLDFTMNSLDLAGKDIVVFETGYIFNEKTSEYVEVCKEDDITNLGQTLHFPEVKTLATDDTYKSHVGVANEQSTLTEKSMLDNLVYGKEYKLVATLVNQITGEDITDNDGNVISKTAIITISDDGSEITAVDENNNAITYEVTDIVKDDNDKSVNIIVLIPFNYNSIPMSGKTTVVFEDLYHNNILVRSHHDLDDKDEQIHYYKLHLYKDGVTDASKVVFTIKNHDNPVFFNKINDGEYNIVLNDGLTEVSPTKDGNLYIHGFNADTYTFVEIKTENGKNLLKTPFDITFNATSDEDGLLKEVVVNYGSKEITLMQENEKEPNAVGAKVTNNEVVTLHTGGSGTKIFFIISFVLMLLGAAALFMKKAGKKAKHIITMLVVCASFAIPGVLSTTVYAEEPDDTILVDDNNDDDQDVPTGEVDDDVVMQEDTDIEIHNLDGDYIPVIDPDKECVLSIDYYDDSDSTYPVVKAMFAAYKVADMDEFGGYISLVDGIDFSKAPGHEEEYITDTNVELVEQKILPAATGTTNEKGHVDLKLTNGLYLIHEILPAEYHTASKPFLVQLPKVMADENGEYVLNDNNEMYWEYTVHVAPKSLPTGHLSLTKFVKGNKGNKNTEFTFRVKVDTIDPASSYSYTKSANGSIVGNGTLKIGEDIKLKSDETIMIKDLPSGLKYEVTEVEANKDGYSTTSTGQTGYITRYQSTVCTFVNTRDEHHTSDVINMTWVFVILGVSILGIGVFFITKKRKK